MEVCKMYDALKMLQFSIITLHLGYQTLVLETFSFPYNSLLQQSSTDGVQDHCQIQCILFKGTN